MTYLYICNLDGKTYTRPGLALLHEKAYGHMSFKVVEEVR
jgi:hypothetical protein